MKLNDPKDAPKDAPRDGTHILGHFGWPWPCVAVWSKLHRKWIYGNYQMDARGNPYFEDESADDKELEGWLEAPKFNETED